MITSSQPPGKAAILIWDPPIEKFQKGDKVKSRADPFLLPAFPNESHDADRFVQESDHLLRSTFVLTYLGYIIDLMVIH